MPRRQVPLQGGWNEQIARENRNHDLTLGAVPHWLGGFFGVDHL